MRLISRWIALIAIAAVAGTAATIYFKGAIAESNPAATAITSTPASSAPSPDSRADSSQDIAQMTVSVLTSGSFVTVEQSHPTAGMAQIIEENGQRFIVFDNTFTTARGPAVEVILYQGNSVPVAIAEGSYISVATLQRFDGSQRYALPADVDISQYGSVGIWCREFNVTFGYADLAAIGQANL